MNLRILLADDHQMFREALRLLLERNADFEVVAETGDRLEKRAYALLIENGYEKHDRFPAVEAAWPGIAPALPLFLAGEVCDRRGAPVALDRRRRQNLGSPAAPDQAAGPPRQGAHTAQGRLRDSCSLTW